MSGLERVRYRRAFTTLFFVMLLFLVVGDFLLLSKERALFIAEEKTQAGRELKLMGTLVREAILKEDYATAEQLILQWGMENSDVASLGAITPAGFALASYKRAGAAKRTVAAEHIERFTGRAIVTLRIEKDLARTFTAIGKLELQTIVVSVIFALVMGVLLWLALKRTALAPMEAAMATLEERVAERTEDLARANRELAGEVQERRDAEESLAYSENYLRSIIENEPECVKILSRDGRILEMNPAGLAMLEAANIEDVRGKSLTDFVPPEHHASLHGLHEKLFGGMKGTAVFEVVGLRGGRRWLETHAVPFRDDRNKDAAMLAVTRDITEHRKLESQLRHSQKMEAIGTLTGGIAHEFNNVLTAIIGYGELLRDEMDSNDPLKQYVDMINTSAERAANLTRSLLAYSRKQITHLEPVDINAMIPEMNVLISNLVPKNIELSTRLSAGELVVMADKAQLEQVLVNLVNNAVDAMPEGGSLSIRTGTIEHGGERAEDSHPQAFISVTDTGKGMDKATKEKIFEPFFTTKDVGKGTGLGLSLVYGMVKKHRGDIGVFSEPGTGTTFKIFLPLTEAVSPLPVKEASAGTGRSPEGGTETILYAEDDPEVRDLISKVLVKAGYTIIQVADGKEAVGKFREHAGSIDLVLMDVVMPNKGGKDALDEISGISPGIKGIFISGYSPENTRIAPGANFISKPVQQRELLSKIREVLDA